jgi:predicted transcriptional regulator
MSVAAATTKEQVMEMVRRLPDDVTMDDIEYHLSVMAGFERGVRDMEAGRFVTQREARERLLRRGSKRVPTTTGWL